MCVVASQDDDGHNLYTFNQIFIYQEVDRDKYVAWTMDIAICISDIIRSGREARGKVDE